MAKIPVAIIVAALMIVFVSVDGHKKSQNKRAAFQITSNADVFQWICQISGNGYTFCTASGTTTKNPPATTAKRTTPGRGPTTTHESDEVTTPAAASTTTTTTTEEQTTKTVGTTEASTSTTSKPTALQLAHWCQYAYNGSWLPYNYTFMHLPCLMCRCQEDHQITCNELQCMNLHCIDGSKPLNITGQCCPQCTYETVSTSCRMNGLTFPHGTRVTTVESDVECWCQSGSIECRKIVTAPTTTTTPKPATVVYTTLSYLPSGMTAYVVVIVICLVLMLGTLLCCGCALAYYYYYQNQQQNIQQAYEQYYNNAGWQPMGVDGQVDGTTAEEKQAEAAGQQAPGNYPTGNSPQYIPPPYAVYSGPYEHKAPEQKQV